jgi:endoglucanase
MKKLIVIISIIGIISLLNGGDKNQSEKMKYVHAAGTEIVAPDGNPLFLRGIGLGNWLVQEGYMFKFGPANSPRLVKSVISELIGPANARRFWQKYYENYITREDIFFIKNSGLNHIRVPFNYRLFTPEEYPEVWLDLGFEIFDRLVAWCKEAQLYIYFRYALRTGRTNGRQYRRQLGLAMAL